MNMKRFASFVVALAAVAATLNAKTLVVYYSFTNNTRTLVNDLRTQLQDADVVEVQPAEEGVDYAANGYAIGSALISAIRNHPDDAASYPAIKDVSVDWNLYEEVIVATPLWWSNMAAPMQTFLFHNGADMAGKRIGLIVSSASSGISGVEADAKRLIPGGVFYSQSLWIRSSQTGNCHTLIADWLQATGAGVSTDLSASFAYHTKVFRQGGLLFVEGDFERLVLLDSTGRAVLTTTHPAADISALPSGIYMVCLTQGNARLSRKVLL